MRKKEKKVKSTGRANRSDNVGEHRLRRAFSLSIIVNLIDKLTDAVYSALIYGFFGRIFTAYSSEQLAFENGFVKNHFRESFGLDSKIRRFRAWLSEHIENSFFVGRFGKLSKSLLSTSLKFYGNFLLSFGLYSMFVYFIRILVPGLAVPESGFLIVSVGMVLCAVPLLGSRVSLAQAIGNGRLTKLIFMEAFGFKEESFDIPLKKSRRRANLAILFGMLCGLLSFFFHPIYIPLVIMILLAVAIIIASPEIGVLATVFLIPFFSLWESPSATLAILVLVSAFGYLVKIIRGKRVFKAELLDLIVIFFAVIIFMGGIISAGGADSRGSALICCILLLGYFLVVNLMRTEQWIKRCVSAIAASSVIVSAVGVIEYVLGYATNGWIDADYFSDINGRVVSLFDNPNVLATYIVLSLPFLLERVSHSESKRSKLLALLSVLTVLVCAVLTWSRGAWLAILASIVIFGLINKRNTFKALLGVGFVVPFLPFVLPDSVVRRFMSIGDLADSSSYYRVYTWRGSLRAIKDYFWGGAGYGNSAYAEIYPQYAYAGIEAAEHSHNLFLQILFGLGIFGLLIFAVILFLFAQKNFEYFKNEDNKDLKLMASAAFAAIGGALVMGMFDHIWYNFRIFYMFWVVMAISCAAIRFSGRERARKDRRSESTPDAASIDI